MIMVENVKDEMYKGKGCLGILNVMKIFTSLSVCYWRPFGESG